MTTKTKPHSTKSMRIARVFQPGGGVIWIRDDGERFFDWYATVQRWRARRKP